jgi:hypothetical protein
MIDKTYQKHNEAWFLGKRVRTLRDLRNGVTLIPKGTVLTIARKSSGFLLEGLPCERCGISVRISDVSHRDVDMVESDSKRHSEVSPKEER